MTDVLIEVCECCGIINVLSKKLKNQRGVEDHAVGFDGNVTKNLLRDHVNSATLVKNNSSHNYQ